MTPRTTATNTQSRFSRHFDQRGASYLTAPSFTNYNANIFCCFTTYSSRRTEQ